jgi:CMP-N-acetylneuraminic acid synthetase
MVQLDGDRLRAFVPGLDASDHPQRQLLPPVFRLNGAVDVTRRLDGGDPFSGDVRGYLMPPERSVDLDTELDFDLAEVLLARRRR